MVALRAVPTNSNSTYTNILSYCGHVVCVCVCVCVQGYSMMYPTIGINVLNSVYWLWLALYLLHMGFGTFFQEAL